MGIFLPRPGLVPPTSLEPVQPGAAQTFSPAYTRVQCVLDRFSCVRLFTTLQTVARQASLSMGFSRQECWSGLPCPSPRAQDTETQSSSVFEALTLRESHGLGFSPASLRANPSPFAAPLPFLRPSPNLTLQTLILLSFTEKQSQKKTSRSPHPTTHPPPWSCGDFLYSPSVLGINQPHS